MSISFKTSPIEFNQRLLFPSNIFDLLTEDHECYLYTDLFQQLDASAVESLYKIKGQNAYHPKLIVSILIYAYSRGVFSSRQIERHCREDLSFILEKSFRPRKTQKARKYSKRYQSVGALPKR